jgi:hypothetical protein
MWQRAVDLKISCGFVIRGNITRNKGRFVVWALSDVDRWVVVICLTLIISKPRSISPSEISCAGVFVGRWCITALMGFGDFG